MNKHGIEFESRKFIQQLFVSWTIDISIRPLFPAHNSEDHTSPGHSRIC